MSEKAPLNTTEVTQQKCRASSGRWPLSGLTVLAPCGYVAVVLRQKKPAGGCDCGIGMSSRRKNSGTSNLPKMRREKKLMTLVYFYVVRMLFFLKVAQSIYE